MPELPEVETIKNDLIKNIQDKKILDIFISSKARINKDKKYFSDFLKENKIKKIDRIGKLLIFDFEQENFLLIHLKMTGQLIYKNK
jgi:formamidopyrimidine-DNA glycosylase